MTITIELGKETDVPLAHQLMIEAFEEYRTLEVPSSVITEPVELLHKNFQDGTEKFIICYDSDQPLGSARFKLYEDSLYFSRVSVSPRARGKGLAKAMLHWLEAYACEHGKSKMECKVRSALQSNIRLYESVGFSIIKKEIIVNPNGLEVKTGYMVKVL
ncbi:GNAT family N-acetyltransferase [Cytobacillus purgationiresistens]|uniref:GNAT superfamily acetyltransferase n=1 Tax=Cytobacillus purgationiresistens TaxID=863449 RepID=A0ABU0APH1_9BACI|nr:GNAT family N-acetyltransferase [Cytobacillus purgationiresistens]MDQ0273176.1 putative GNAT superfamily acetyltransferase [Cytobacillus purgationiresistens]